jgi:hypothetical protein
MVVRNRTLWICAMVAAISVALDFMGGEQFRTSRPVPVATQLAQGINAPAAILRNVYWRLTDFDVQVFDSIFFFFASFLQWVCMIACVRRIFSPTLIAPVFFWISVSISSLLSCAMVYQLIRDVSFTHFQLRHIFGFSWAVFLGSLAAVAVARRISIEKTLRRI